MKTLLAIVLTGCAVEAIPPGTISAEPVEWYYQPDASRANATHPVIDRNESQIQADPSISILERR